MRRSSATSASTRLGSFQISGARPMKSTAHTTARHQRLQTPDRPKTVRSRLSRPGHPEDQGGGSGCCVADKEHSDRCRRRLQDRTRASPKGEENVIPTSDLANVAMFQRSNLSYKQRRLRCRTDALYLPGRDCCQCCLGPRAVLATKAELADRLRLSGRVQPNCDPYGRTAASAAPRPSGMTRLAESLLCFGLYFSSLLAVLLASRAGLVPVTRTTRDSGRRVTRLDAVKNLTFSAEVRCLRSTRMFHGCQSNDSVQPKPNAPPRRLCRFRSTSSRTRTPRRERPCSAQLLIISSRSTDRRPRQETAGVLLAGVPRRLWHYPKANPRCNRT